MVVEVNNVGERVSETNLCVENFKRSSENLTATQRSSRPSQVVFTRPLEGEKSEYYEEWLQKCVAWIAIGCGIKRMDFHSLEKVTNFVVNHIKNLGRRAKYLSRVRGCESSNFVDVMSALEEVDPVVYGHIFKEKLPSKTKQMPKLVPILPHNTLTQPVQLSQPSALYFECMANATEQLSELNREGKDDSGVYNSVSRVENKGKNKSLETVDMEYLLTYSNRNPYSFKADEIYQQIAASRPKFLHKHMPMLPPEFILTQKPEHKLSYNPDSTKSSERLTRQNLLLQSDLPMLHRVQIEPEFEELKCDYNSN